MQGSATKTRTNRQSVSSKKTGRTDSITSKSASVKRSLKDTKLKQRSVRFRSTDEEYFFEIEPADKIVIPDGSDIFQTILQDMKDDSEHDTYTADDDAVFDGVFTATVDRLAKKTTETSDDDTVFAGVFTATVDRLAKKTDVNKGPVPRKSILKRRNSYRR